MAISPRKKNGPTQGFEPMTLKILITVVLPTELQVQNESRVWVLQILFYGMEARKEGLAVHCLNPTLVRHLSK